MRGMSTYVRVKQRLEIVDMKEKMFKPALKMTSSSLAPRALQPLTLGAIKPRGWLLDQLRLQADGLTGHLDEFWPSVRDSRWIGGGCEGWERAPYWLDGLIPLAFLLDDDKLKAKAKRWIDHILSRQHEDGWLGAKDDAHEGEGLAQLDLWPLFVLFKAFLQWRDATDDERVVPALLRCARRVQLLVGTEPLRSWAMLRWADFVVSLHQLYELSGEAWLLELAATCAAQGYDWNAHFADLPMKRKTRHEDLGEEVGLPLHGVNNAMGLKTGAVQSRQNLEDAPANRPQFTSNALAVLDEYHGAASGMFNADEHLAGLSPSQGFETCAVVEEMFSLEVAGAITGQAALFDRLEQIAFNALPASCSADMWSHQYHQQTNQVLCSDEPRDWTDSGSNANVFGQDVNFGCCQANLHQGWPKLAASLWMKTVDGIALAAYAPCEVSTCIGETEVVLTEETDYPFRGDARISVRLSRPVRFNLRLRVPQWTRDFSLEINGQQHLAQPAQGWLEIAREWRDNDEIVLRLSMPVREERRANGAVSLHRGPLLLALPLAEEWRAIGSPYVEAESRAQEWEIRSQSPWNFALDMNETRANLEVEESPISAKPFNNSEPHLRVSVRARRAPDWKLENHSASPPVAVKASLEYPIETLKLIPYGCARLRVAEFPCIESD